MSGSTQAQDSDQPLSDSLSQYPVDNLDQVYSSWKLKLNLSQFWWRRNWPSYSCTQTSVSGCWQWIAKKLTGRTRPSSLFLAFDLSEGSGQSKIDNSDVSSQSVFSLIITSLHWLTLALLTDFQINGSDGNEKSMARARIPAQLSHDEVIKQISLLPYFIRSLKFQLYFYQPRKTISLYQYCGSN